MPTRALAVLPDSVSFSVAATLPIAGLTALVAVEKYPGGQLARTVLVTGASGGAGNFAIQLARAASGRVVALIRRPETEALVRAAGADDVEAPWDEIGSVAKRLLDRRLVGKAVLHLSCLFVDRFRICVDTFLPNHKQATSSAIA